jgi:hypothetical protein
MILFALVAFSSIYSNWLPIRSVPASDFYQFWVVGQELTAGRAGDIYSEGERQRIGERYLHLARSGGDAKALRTARQRARLETFSTPFLYAVFGSLSSGDYDRDLDRFRVLGLFSVLFSVVVLCRLLGYGALSTIAAMTVFGAWFAPTRSDWLVGNVNSIQLLCLSLFLWLSYRAPKATGYVAGGILLGLSAMFKPNSTLIILFLLGGWAARRRSEKFMYVSVGLGIAAFVAFAWSSFVFEGMSIWRSWFLALSKLPPDIITVELGNYAPARLLSEWIQIDAAVVIALACGALVVGAIARGLSGGESGDVHGGAGLEDVHLVALAGLVALLSSPLAWLHYFVAAIPMLLISLRPEASFEGRGPGSVASRAIAWIALLAVMMRPLVILDVGDDRSRAIFLCIGTTMLFVLGLRSLMAFRTAPTIANDGG